MKLEELILKGKRNKKNREELMRLAHLDRDSFKKELSKIKETQIILFEEGYYKPNTEEEYDAFIKKCNTEIKNIQHLVELATKEKKNIGSEVKWNGR